MVQRVTYRRKNTYNTRSNKFRRVRTPGGRVTTIHRAKIASLPKPMLQKLETLGGLRRLAPAVNKRQNKMTRRVNRAYGGALTATELRDRIMRAFIYEEVKIVKKVLSEEEAKVQTKKSKKGKKKSKK